MNETYTLSLAAIEAGPFCALMFADMCAEIIRIDRKGTTAMPDDYKFNVMNLSRQSVAIDLKNPAGVVQY
jgi:alpha-methylacyl-CoA racemase